MRISDWSSDVCSSDLPRPRLFDPGAFADRSQSALPVPVADLGALAAAHALLLRLAAPLARLAAAMDDVARYCIGAGPAWHGMAAARALAPVCPRSEEHTSELQSLMRISYAVFCLKK